MRVGIDLRGVIYDSARRGIGVYASNLVRGLMNHAPSDWEFVLFCRQGFPLPDLLQPLPPRWSSVMVEGWSWQDPKAHWPLMRIPKVRALPMLRNPYMRALATWNQSAFERAIKASDVQLLHLVSAVDLGSYPVINLTIPTVASFLDAIPLRERGKYFDAWSPSMKSHYQAQIDQLSRVATVVAISNFSRDDAIRYGGVEANRTATVYPVVHDRWYEVPDRAWASGVRERFDLTGPYFVFCSALDGHKNWERMLEAFVPHAQRAHLVLVARDGGPEAEAFRSLRGRLGLPPERCILTGWIEDHELVGLVDGAAALVSPSLQEGFGLPAAQAQALGTPVLSSTGGSLPEVVADAGLLFDPLDVHAQSAAMERALTEDLRGIFASRQMELRDRFREEVVTDQLVRVYRDLI